MGGGKISSPTQYKIIMSELKGTNIAAAIKPFTTLDKYATHDEEYGRGGYRSVNSISEMNAIPSDRRKEGMLVKITSSNSYYTLKNGIFQLENFGSGGGSSSSNLELINLIDISENPVTNVTPSSSLVDEFYNISRAFTNNKSAVANWFNDVQGIFPISIADIYSDIIIFSVFYYDRIVKVRYDSNTNKYSTELLFSNGNDSSFYTTTANILGILDGTANLWDSYNYSKISELVENLEAGKYIKYNNQATSSKWVSSILNVLYANSVMEGIEISFIGLNSNGKLVKVYGKESTSETIITNLESASAPNLDMDVRIGKNPDGEFAVYFKVKEIHENGYIQHSRLKKQLYKVYKSSSLTKYKVKKYAIESLWFGNMPGIAAKNIQANVWYEYPIISGTNLINKYTKGTSFNNGTVAHFNTVRFRGNINANPITYSLLTDNASPSKITSVMHLGLQYNIVNPNFGKRIREGGKIPSPIVYEGELKKIRARIRAQIWSINPKLYLNLE